MSDTVTDRDVYITRSFDAPRALVWKFWTDPDHLAEWFGPSNVTTPRETVSITPAVGGEWSLEMHDSATGAVYPMATRFVEVREPEYLEMVIDAATSDIVGELETLRLRVTFHDHGEKTRITLHQGPFTEEQKSATSTGWEESFVKMDALLAGDAA